MATKRPNDLLDVIRFQDALGFHPAIPGWLQIPRLTSVLRALVTEGGRLPDATALVQLRTRALAARQQQAGSDGNGGSGSVVRGSKGLQATLLGSWEKGGQDKGAHAVLVWFLLAMQGHRVCMYVVHPGMLRGDVSVHRSAACVIVQLRSDGVLVTLSMHGIIQAAYGK